MVLRSVQIYTAYFQQFLKTRLAYRADFAASIAANMLVSLSGVVFILLLMDGSTIGELKGWKKDEVLFIYGYSLIGMAVFVCVAPNLYHFGDRYIIQGQFDRVLLRPLDSLCQVLFESFNLESVGTLIVGLGLLWYTGGRLGVEFSLLDCIWLLLSGLSGGVILLSVFVFLASLSFHFEDRLGISPPVYNLIQFGRYPINIFHPALQFVLRWVIPFAFVAFYPATHFFARRGFSFYCYLTPFVAALALAVALTAWRFGVSRYSSTGS